MFFFTLVCSFFQTLACLLLPLWTWLPVAGTCRGFRDQVGAKNEWLTVHELPKEDNLHTDGLKNNKKPKHWPRVWLGNKWEIKIWRLLLVRFNCWLHSATQYSTCDAHCYLLPGVSDELLEHRINTQWAFTANIINKSAGVASFPLEPTDGLTARSLGSWEQLAAVKLFYHQWLSTRFLHLLVFWPVSKNNCPAWRDSWWQPF